MTNIFSVLKKLNLKKKNERVFYAKKKDICLNIKDILKIAKIIKDKTKFLEFVFIIMINQKSMK